MAAQVGVGHSHHAQRIRHEARHRHSGARQHAHDRRAGILGADGVDQHPHFDAARPRLDQGLRHLASDRIVVEDVALHRHAVSRIPDGLQHGRIGFVAASQGLHLIAAQQPEPADAVAQHLERCELLARDRRHIHRRGLDQLRIHHHGLVAQLRHTRLADPIDSSHKIEQRPEQRREHRHPDPADGRPHILFGHRGMHRRAGARHNADGKYQMGPIIDQNCVYAIHSDGVRDGLQR
ncbi:hypothetical protein D3C87_1465300 [compost metagenome]